jgi:cation transport ATPase
MVGDGVNDGPALKGQYRCRHGKKGTETKEAADLILIDDDLSK